MSRHLSADLDADAAMVVAVCRVLLMMCTAHIHVRVTPLTLGRAVVAHRRVTVRPHHVLMRIRAALLGALIVARGVIVPAADHDVGHRW